MAGDKEGISPIMTNSESILQFGNNAYGKPATALNILRETIMGRELFDYSFKEYARRWQFKHPSPDDFFRTMEDASAVDLDWFWRGWFFTTDNVDIALTDVKWFQINSQDPDKENALTKQQEETGPRRIGSIRNEKEIAKTQDEVDTSLRDFYTDYDPLAVSVLDKEDYEKFYTSLSEDEKAVLGDGRNYYEMTFKNEGGLIMPIIIQLQFADGTMEDHYIPAEIWRRNNDQVTKVLVTEKEVSAIVIDPYLETADTDRSNNYFPARQEMNRFELYRSSNRGSRENPMQRDQRAKAAAGSN
jgi:hypothetical protein